MFYLNFLQVPPLYEIPLISTVLFGTFDDDTLIKKYFITELLHDRRAVVTISLRYHSRQEFST